jgi:hypothetical protein
MIGESYETQMKPLNSFQNKIPSSIDFTFQVSICELTGQSGLQSIVILL